MANNNKYKSAIYYTFPNLSSPKIWISASDKPSIALKLYNPSTLRGRIAKSIFSFLPTYITHKILPKCNPPDISIINTLVLSNFEPENITASYYLATDGGDKKLTAQISGNKTIIAYVKISSDDRYTESIKNELKALKTLNSSPSLAKHAPSILFNSVNNNYYMLCQSAPKGNIRQRTLALCKADIEFLSLVAEHHNKTMALKIFIESRMPDNKLLSEISNLREWLLSHNQKEITLTLAHGDYAPWNTYIINNSIYAFDWEYYMDSAPALYDIMHFLYMNAWLVDKKKPVGIIKILKRLTDDKSLEKLLFTAHIDKSNISIYIGMYLYMHCYWKSKTSNSIPSNAKECINILVASTSDT